MDYKIEIDRRALRTLGRLSIDLRRRLGNLIDSLASNPHPAGAKCLNSAKGVWRVRKGDFRIAYAIRQNELIVLILHIADRKDFYRQLKRLGIIK